MTRKRYFPILIAVIATALFVVPGIALSKGGNGTPNPPPSNPPCDADGHGGSPPPYAGPNNNSGSCDNGGSTGNGGTGQPTNPPCDADNHENRLPKGLVDKCPSTTGSSSSTSTSSSSTSTSTSTSSSTTGDVCETDGVLGTKGLGLLSPDDRTIGQIVWDEIGIVVQDPQIPEGGPISGPLYDGLLQLPLNGFESPIAAEVGCLLNNLSL
jgi:hypothetical protein